MEYGRRDVLKFALGALPAAPFLMQPSILGILGQDKPNSVFGGVQVGIIAPYAFRGTARNAADILKSVVELGINAIELQSPPVERFVGVPRGGGRGATNTSARRAAEELREWRGSVSMDKFVELREMYARAGVRIYAFKLELNASMADEELDYCFKVAKALGADHVTTELRDDVTERAGEFAAKHEVHIAYHNHTQVDETSWDDALGQSAFNGINLDVGHFTAAISKSAIPFIRKHHARIRSMHLKDRKYGTNGSTNMPWGEGDTPLREVLQLMKEEKYTFPATIELEYTVPEDSTVQTELRKCLAYCKAALT